MTRLSRFLPPPGVARSLALQSMIYATGTGVFLTGSAVFFVHVVGLRPTQVGVGVSVAGAISLVLSVPLGMLVDRVGSRRTWMVAVFCEAALFCGYPFVRGFWGFLAVVSAVAVTSTAGNSGRSVYTIEAIAPEQRVRVLAFSRSALNIGFTLGALGAGVALSINSRPAYYAMVLANAVGLVVNGLCLFRLPVVPRQHVDRSGHRFAALRDRPILAVTALVALLGSFATVFTEVIPLWTVTRTNAPRVVLSAMFLVNTALVVLLQVPASRGAETLPGATRALRRGGFAVALACPVLYLTRAAPRPVTIALLVLAIGLVTACELWHSAGFWGLTTELPPPGRRGEYVGALRLGNELQAMVAPAALTALAIGTGGWGWLVIAGMFVAGALAAGPVVAWAGRTPRLGTAAAPEPEPAQR
jgi:MFS family permease